MADWNRESLIIGKMIVRVLWSFDEVDDDEGRYDVEGEEDESENVGECELEA